MTVGVSRDHNGSAPKLYIEFEDDEAASEPGEAILVSAREVVGGLAVFRPTSWKPPWALVSGALPTRFRKLAAGAVVLAGLAAMVSGALVAQASQQQATRSTVAIVSAAYSPSADDQSLNLLVDLADTSPTAVTVTQLQAHQSDLSLSYIGEPVSLAKTEQLEIVLSGAYDCSAASTGSAAQTARDARPGDLRMTVRTVQGNVTTVDVPLPASAQLPDRWQSGRAAYCALSWVN